MNGSLKPFKKHWETKQDHNFQAMDGFCSTPVRRGGPVQKDAFPYNMPSDKAGGPAQHIMTLFFILGSPTYKVVKRCFPNVSLMIRNN